jgi:hypothetical protein
VEGSGRGLIWSIISIFPWLDWENPQAPSVRITGLQEEIWSRDFVNAMQEWHLLGRKILFLLDMKPRSNWIGSWRMLFHGATLNSPWNEVYAPQLVITVIHYAYPGISKDLLELTVEYIPNFLKFVENLEGCITKMDRFTLYNLLRLLTLFSNFFHMVNMWRNTSKNRAIYLKLYRF